MKKVIIVIIALTTAQISVGQVSNLSLKGGLCSEIEQKIIAC